MYECYHDDVTAWWCSLHCWLVASHHWSSLARDRECESRFVVSLPRSSHKHWVEWLRCQAQWQTTLSCIISMLWQGWLSYLRLGPILVADGRLVLWSHGVSRPRDLCLVVVLKFDGLLSSSAPYAPGVFSELGNDLNNRPRDLETSRGLALRRLVGRWTGAMVSHTKCTDELISADITIAVFQITLIFLQHFYFPAILTSEKFASHHQHVYNYFDRCKDCNGRKSQEFALLWRHNGCDGVSSHRYHKCLLSRLFRSRSKKHQSSPSLASVRGIHRWPVKSPYKGAVTRKMFPFDDVIMQTKLRECNSFPFVILLNSIIAD